MTKTDVNKLFLYWQEEAEYSKSVMQLLLKSKKYAEALFFGHLTLEKMIKAYYVLHHRKHAPPIHNLIPLFKQSELVLLEEQMKELNEISRFNMAGRYDEQKQTFRKECTAKFATEQAKIIEEYLLWLKKELSREKSVR